MILACAHCHKSLTSYDSTSIIRVFRDVDSNQVLYHAACWVRMRESQPLSAATLTRSQ